ncbi:MAG TPA: sulfite exporter TauE/SafE family protein, partial [Candidatus Obscuribacter sp.]|nr:sulfite exporter TauE/SafE family protein [Candidatus Obscuribacter sp.]
MLHMLIAASSGIATGSLLGLLGGGGSIIAVPVLVYLLGFDAKTAVASSLLVVAFASLLAAYSHFRHKAVVVSTALVFGGAGGIGSLAGAQLAGLLSDSVQLTAFALVMALVALLMLRAKPPDI